MPKRFRVIVTPDAEEDLQAIYRYLRDRSAQAADGWMSRLSASIETLSHFPERCPLAPEIEHYESPVRQMLFGSGNRGTYRIIFALIDNSVFILHVRHGSRLPLDSEDDEI